MGKEKKDTIKNNNLKNSLGTKVSDWNGGHPKANNPELERQTANPTAPGLQSQKVEEDREHDFNILGNGQKEDLEEEKPHGALPSGSGARGKR